MRRAGTLFVHIDGIQRDAIGDFSYNLGTPKRTGLVGPDRIHGYSEMPQLPYVEGEIRDQSDLDVAEMQRIADGTVTLELANGKTVVLRNAWYAADGTVGTENANVQVRFEGQSAEEIAA